MPFLVKMLNAVCQEYWPFFIFSYKVSVSTSSLHTHLYNGHQIDTRKQTELSESTSSLKSFFKIAKPGQEIAYVNGKEFERSAAIMYFVCVNVIFRANIVMIYISQLVPAFLWWGWAQFGSVNLAISLLNPAEF